MSKPDDAYQRLTKFEAAFRKTYAVTGALAAGYDQARESTFDEAVRALCDDIKRVLGAVEDAEDYRERLHDVVMLDAEAAIGCGPGFRDRSDKAWGRARELFEP